MCNKIINNIKTGKIFNIQHFSIGDGPGIRTTVFLKGCNLHCMWCHNPESHSVNTEIMHHKEKCVGCGECLKVCPSQEDGCILCGKCVKVCPQDAKEICGKEYTAEQVLEEIMEDVSFYENSEGGVTFSGGECMLQTEFLMEILGELKKKGIHTAVDTAGDVPWESFEKILPFTDMFLVDIKTMCNETHKKFTGAKNTRILENIKKLFMSEKRIWVRIPVICGVNDTIEDMEKIKSFLNEYGYPEKVELLPYHSIGEHKYNSLNKPFFTFNAPDAEKIEVLKTVFI